MARLEPHLSNGVFSYSLSGRPVVVDETELAIGLLDAGGGRSFTRIGKVRVVGNELRLEADDGKSWEIWPKFAGQLYWPDEPAKR